MTANGFAPALAIGSGFATFVIVGAVVEQLAHYWIDFALFLALPIGALAGAVAVAGVVAGLTGEVSDRSRRGAGAFAGLSIGFFVGTVAAAEGLHYDVTSSAAIGAAVGLLLAVWLSSRV